LNNDDENDENDNDNDLDDNYFKKVTPWLWVFKNILYISYVKHTDPPDGTL
jgi:hypothetical protein